MTTQFTEMLDAFQAVTHVLCTVPPSRLDTQAVDLLAGHASSLSNLKWVGYLSSTGVYGDWGGNWVDESCTIRPVADKAKQRAGAEAAWLNLYQQHKLPVHCFRLGGIYGPGRSALEAVQQQGGASASQQRRGLQQYTARCHMHDICTALFASMHQPCPGSLYNVVDDNPASRAEVMAFAAQLLGPPLDVFASDKHNADSRQQTFADPDSADASAKATGSNDDLAAVHTNTDELAKHRSISKRAEKRVSNSKIKSELGLTWEFPSYVEGLSAIHKGDRRPFD